MASEARSYVNQHNTKLYLTGSLIDLRREPKECGPDAPAVFRYDAPHVPPRVAERLRTLAPVMTTERMEKIVIPLITGKGIVSLRSMEWLVINYAKANVLVLHNKTSSPVRVYQNYREWRTFWKRELFDAFRRGTRTLFTVGGCEYETTAGQLNYLMWCENTGVLEFALNNHAAVEEHMTSRVSECRRIKSDLKRKGVYSRNAFFSNPDVPCVVYQTPGTVHFDKRSAPDASKQHRPREQPQDEQPQDEQQGQQEQQVATE